MNDVFVVCNQLGQYWGKKKKWVDGTDPKRVLTCKHEDEAVNQLVELGARDIDLRGEVRAVETSERGIPQVVPSEHLIAEEPESLAEPAVTGDETLPEAEDTPAGEVDDSAGETPPQP